MLGNAVVSHCRLPPPPPQLPLPPPLLGKPADVHPAGPPCCAACNYKAIPEPTEPAKYDTANAGDVIAQKMVEAGLELAGEAVGGFAGKAISSRERAGRRARMLLRAAASLRARGIRARQATHVLLPS